MNNLNNTHTSDNGAIQSQIPRTSAQGPYATRPGGQNYTYGRSEKPRRGSNGANGVSNGYNFEDFSTMPDVPADGFSDTGNGYTDYGRRPQYLKHAKRTLHLINLPDSVTHAEITDVIRGGMLLDIYIRSNDRIAAVSFLEEESAQAFFQHVKRNDLYIRGRRVSIVHRSLINQSDSKMTTRLTFDGVIDILFCLAMVSLYVFPDWGLIRLHFKLKSTFYLDFSRTIVPDLLLTME